jgi:hypothetical protein
VDDVGAVVVVAVLVVAVLVVERAGAAVEVAPQPVAATITVNSIAHTPPRSTNGLTAAGYLPQPADLAEG